MQYTAYKVRIFIGKNFISNIGAINIPEKTGKYIECEYCEKIVYKTSSQYNKRKNHFCSNKCQGAYNRILAFEHRDCEVCGGDIYVSKRSTQRFCSIQCQSAWQKKNVGFRNPKFEGDYIQCEYCHQSFIVGKSKLEDGRNHFCSAACRREWYAKVWSQSDEWKEQSRQRAVRIRAANQHITLTKPQKITNGLLDDMAVVYQNERPFKYYSMDNYLSDVDLAIEVMGDFWHCSPLKYTEVIHAKQREIVGRDVAKSTFIRNYYDICILYLWEADLLKCPEMCKELIKLYINHDGALDNYNSFNYSLRDGEIRLNDNIILSHQERRSLKIAG